MPKFEMSYYREQRIYDVVEAPNEAVAREMFDGIIDAADLCAADDQSDDKGQVDCQEVLPFVIKEPHERDTRMDYEKETHD